MLSAPQPSPRVPAPASARGQDLLRNDGEEMLSSVNTRVLTCGGIGRLLPTHTGLSPARSGQRENPITRPHSSPSGRVGRADGPEQREVWTRVCNRSTIPPVSPQPFSGEAKGTAGLIVVDTQITIAPLHRIPYAPYHHVVLPYGRASQDPPGSSKSPWSCIRPSTWIPQREGAAGALLLQEKRGICPAGLR